MKDIIVVGGGLSGMLTARYLHDAGLRTLLIDQNELGCEASRTGNGVISPLYPWHSSAKTLELSHTTQQHYADLCAELLAETRIDPELTTSGLLVLDTAECAAAQSWLAAQDHQGAPADSNTGTLLTSNAAVKEHEPALHSDCKQAVFMPNIRQVRNPFLVKAVAASLRMRPVTISEHQPVTTLKIKKNRVKGVKLNGKTFKADKVIMATGVGSAAFGELKSVIGRQTLLKEDIILFRGSPGLLNHIIVQDGYYLIPRQDGRILCGTIRPTESKAKQTTEATYTELRDFAQKMIPALHDVPIRNHWAGVYARNNNATPSVGAHPDIKGLYLNAGHGEEGMATGLAAVRKLVAKILK